MREQTTHDLRNYVARGRANMPADVPSKPTLPAAVYPMCERCGRRDEQVRLVRVGRFVRYMRQLCPGCGWHS